MGTIEFLGKTIPLLEPKSLLVYLLGLSSFILTIIDHWVNPKKEFRSIGWYFQELIYTIISIIIGISFCVIVETSQGVGYMVIVGCGLLGSTIIRKFRTNKDKIAEGVVDKLEDVIEDKLDAKVSEAINNENNQNS